MFIRVQRYNKKMVPSSSEPFFLIGSDVLVIVTAAIIAATGVTADAGIVGRAAALFLSVSNGSESLEPALTPFFRIICYFGVTTYPHFDIGLLFGAMTHPHFDIGPLFGAMTHPHFDIGLLFGAMTHPHFDIGLLFGAMTHPHFDIGLLFGAMTHPHFDIGLLFGAMTVPHFIFSTFLNGSESLVYFFQELLDLFLRGLGVSKNSWICSFPNRALPRALGVTAGAAERHADQRTVP